MQFAQERPLFRNIGSPGDLAKVCFRRLVIPRSERAIRYAERQSETILARIVFCLLAGGSDMMHLVV